MDPLDLLCAGRPWDAYRAADALLNENPKAPGHRKRVWGLVLHLAARQHVIEADKAHRRECGGCAWCVIGTPEPFDLEAVEKLETTSSLRSEG